MPGEWNKKKNTVSPFDLDGIQQEMEQTVEEQQEEDAERIAAEKREGDSKSG